MCAINICTKKLATMRLPSLKGTISKISPRLASGYLAFLHPLTVGSLGLACTYNGINGEPQLSFWASRILVHGCCVSNGLPWAETLHLSHCSFCCWEKEQLKYTTSQEGGRWGALCVDFSTPHLCFNPLLILRPFTVVNLSQKYNRMLNPMNPSEWIRKHRGGCWASTPKMSLNLVFYFGNF